MVMEEQSPPGRSGAHGTGPAKPVSGVSHTRVGEGGGSELRPRDRHAAGPPRAHHAVAGSTRRFIANASETGTRAHAKPPPVRPDRREPGGNDPGQCDTAPAAAHVTPEWQIDDLLEEVRQAIRARQFSPRTEGAYLAWTRRYVSFAGGSDPRELDDNVVTAFLTDLAVEHRVSSATQRQAASALLFLHREVLGRSTAPPDEIVRPHLPRRLPTVLT
ncbi:MAG TPA: site-specific integrase, partial [Longimicrobiales bacterium]